MRSLLALLLLLICATAIYPVHGASTAISGTNLPFLEPLSNPIYIGESPSPYNARIYFYAVNPSPYNATIAPHFKGSLGVTILNNPSPFNETPFSVSLISLDISIPSGDDDALINYSTGSSTGSLELYRLPVMLQEIAIEPLPSYFIAKPGGTVPISIVFNSPLSLSISYTNSSLVSPIYGNALEGTIQLPRGISSSVLSYPVSVSGSIKGERFTLTVPIFISAVYYTGDGLPLSYTSLAAVLKYTNQTIFKGAGPVAYTDRITSATTTYLVLNFTRAPASFWVALNETSPINFTYYSGVIKGNGLLEGWVRIGNCFLLAFNTTEPVTWDIGSGSNASGWLPPKRGLWLGTLLGYQMLWVLVAGSVIILLLVLAYFVEGRKKGWPYNWG